MNQLVTLFDLIIIIGIVQGLVTSVLLLRRDNRGDRFLALSIVSFCLLSSKILLHTLGLWQGQIFRYFPLGIDLAIQPLIYWHVMQLIEPKLKFQRRDLLHFVPFAVSEVYSLVVYFSVLSTTDLAAKDVIAERLHFNLVKHFEDYLTLISSVTYITIGIVKLRHYKRRLGTNGSVSSDPIFKWLSAIITQLIVVAGFLCFNLFVDRVLFPGSSNFLRWQLFNIVVAGHIYYLGFMGYSRSPLSQYRQLPKLPKVEKLTPRQVTEIAGKIDQSLTRDKAYLNPQLSATDLATAIDTTQGNLSYALNHHYGKNFRELVNQCRVEEAKSKLADPSLAHLSILGIAYESGFSSEASFYRIFKKSTGRSPADYQKESRK
ncbi:MAG: helix-turn-helix domain-containing protein [Bacteroidota bacterium]